MNSRVRDELGVGRMTVNRSSDATSIELGDQRFEWEICRENSFSVMWEGTDPVVPASV